MKMRSVSCPENFDPCLKDTVSGLRCWTTLASIQAMMTIYIILGLLGDDTEYVADENILTPTLSTTKVSIIFRNDQE